MRVEPDGEPPFKAKVVIRINKLGERPDAGSTVVVLYDPDDHSKVAFDVAATKAQQDGDWGLRHPGFTVIEPPGAPTPAPASDPVDQLEKLAQLHSSGDLTDDEFAAEKAKLISS